MEDLPNEEEKTAEELVENLKTITDQHKLTDAIVSGEKVIRFRCSGSGLFFPADYLKEWGRKYGHGLGASPVSECLETDWYQECAIPKNMRSVSQIMYPVKQGGHQVDAFILSKEASEQVNMAIKFTDDPFGALRAKIIRDKQLNNPNGRLKQIVHQHS